MGDNDADNEGDDADDADDNEAGDDSEAADGGFDGDTKEFCYRDITLLNDPSRDDPNAVARGHSDSGQDNTLNNDPLVGATFNRLTAVDPEDAKREDGAAWAAGGVAPFSDAAGAMAGAGPDAASAASLGASIVKGVVDAVSSAVSGLGAAIGAIF
jgi:hypothetical protein